VKEPPETRSGELYADEIFATRLRIAHMNNFAFGGEIGFLAASAGLHKWNVDVEIGAHGDIEARDERSSSAAQIFAGSLLNKRDAPRISPANGERQPDGNTALRARPLWSLSSRGTSCRNHARPPSVDHEQVNRSVWQPKPGRTRSNRLKRFGKSERLGASSDGDARGLLQQEKSLNTIQNFLLRPGCMHRSA
jgi:hypothetical protein